MYDIAEKPLPTAFAVWDETSLLDSTQSNAFLLSMDSLPNPTPKTPLPKDVATASPATSTARGSNANATRNEKLLRLEFSDYSDLQTRLVLMPLVEEEGKGAIVASFTRDKKALAPKDNGQRTSEPSKEHRDDEESTTDGKLTGCVLIGMDSETDDWKDEDFSFILARIREEEAPITLFFEPPKLESPPSSPAPSLPKQVQVETPSQQKPSETSAAKEPLSNTKQDSLQSGMMALSAWGMRMGARAAGAANNAAALASKAAKERMQQTNQATKIRTAAKACDIFLQTSVGAFIPISAAQSKVTTSSLLLVRKSATEACPPSPSHSFQWYRSALPSPGDDAASLGSKSRTSDQSVNGEEIEWIALDGAIHAAFQPNATLVGRRLRCIVSISPDDNSSDDSSLEDADLDSAGPQICVCDIMDCVMADMTLFNGARQALLRGAGLAGFQGRGNAINRKFRIEVSIGTLKKRKRITSSAVRVYQMSGNESEPLNESPVLHVSATADPCKPKLFELILPPMPETSILTALCTDGALQLEAPNRVARESLLLALGIANYTGEPANLDGKTVLFGDETVAFDDNDSSSCATSSCASSVGSQAKSTVSNPKSLECSVGSLKIETEGDRVIELEKELESLRNKLARKDKIVSELQRQITKSESVYQQSKQALSSKQQQLDESKAQCQELSQNLKASCANVQSQEAKASRMREDHLLHVSSLENRITSQSGKIAELEKANRILQNEKAVLAAAVEARESKLVKMGELQSSFKELSETVQQQDKLRVQLEESNKRYESLNEELERVTQFEKECRAELKETKQTVERLTDRISHDEETVASVHTTLDVLQKKNQQLKGERNSFKQKNDSLSKEISRLCRNGRSIQEIEKIMSDHESRKQEVALLRQQKRKALEEAHLYRTSYEQSKFATQIAGVDVETHRALERNAELERLLAEMTEYVNAKEMQMETMKQVNEHLQSEIHSLAQASLNKDEV